MSITYLCKFSEEGRRGATYVKEEKTAEEIAALKAKGFLEIKETDYALLLGNVDGQEYIRNTDGTYSPYVPPAPSLESLKEQKLEDLDAAFLEWRNDTAVMKSSLGFTADADTRAMLDIAGLATLGTGAVFMDADNQPHELTAEEISVLQKEVVQSGTAAYSQKWALREAINAADSAAALDAIKIEFSASDFSA
jgi:hypothetical protein